MAPVAAMKTLKKRKEERGRERGAATDAGGAAATTRKARMRGGDGCGGAGRWERPNERVR